MINSVCVCGGGTMGSGIAQAAAQAGIDTRVFDVDIAVLDRAKEAISRSLQALVQKGKITAADQQLIAQRIKYTSQITDCVADLFIEAIVEKLEVKIRLINQLAELNGESAIYASNTSSLSIQAIADAVTCPGRVAGMHFFNPATIMKLVEIVVTDLTPREVTNELSDFARRLGKSAVICRDSPGFTVNRVARPYYIESLRLVEEGYATFETIDSVLETAGFRMGPFRLMDLIGNDVNFAVSCSVFDQLGRPERLRPSFLQEARVKAGELGKKTGKGYYTY
jgi:3-hydroxybutyryl-CoA dehydrogenase